MLGPGPGCWAQQHRGQIAHGNKEYVIGRELSTARESGAAPEAEEKHSLLRWSNHRGARGWLEEREGDSAWRRKSEASMCPQQRNLVCIYIFLNLNST